MPPDNSIWWYANDLCSSDMDILVDSINSGILWCGDVNDEFRDAGCEVISETDGHDSLHVIYVGVVWSVPKS